MPYSQDSRMCVLETPLGKDALILTNMNAEEKVSELFRYQLGLASHEGEVKFDQIIGKSVTVELHVGDSERYFNGIVSRFSQGGTFEAGSSDLGLVFYQAEVVPWVWLLTRTTNCRVWEQKSVKDILEDVLGDTKYGGGAYQFENVNASYDPIEYCVQYRETDFAFVSRMMEEHGLFYSFRHEQGAHTMVISDTSSSCSDCPGHETLNFGNAPAEGDVAAVEEWFVEQELHPGKYALDAYDFLNPSEDLLAPTNSTISVGGNDKLEIFDVPTHYLTSKQGPDFVKLRMEEEEASHLQVRAQSCCGGLVPGTQFTLKGHYCKAFNERNFVTSVTHSIKESVGYEGGAGGSSYENSFTCLPDRIAFRPRLKTPKPQIAGTQTALVVGPAGEEIHCDKYGRVRIQFYWDRQGPTDGTAVCWARVSHSSAGKQWGSIHIPRIGQEVVVTFLDGDPDRPLITGMVYNAEQMPPYELPANKTQSGIKTRSSLKASPENFNEIRFEDKKDSEEVYIHAEKDMNEVVEHDRTRNVGNDERIEIGHDRNVQVTNNHDEQIGQDESLSVEANRTRSVGASETITIGKNQDITIEADRTLAVAKNHTISIDADQKESVEGSYQTSVAKEYLLEAKKIQLVAKDEFTVKVGRAKLIMKKNGNIDIKGAKINMKGSSNVIVKGSNIKEN